MRKKQTRELRKVIKEKYFNDEEQKRIYNSVKNKEGSLRKLIQQEFFKKGSIADVMYKKGKERFNSLPKNKKDLINI